MLHNREMALRLVLAHEGGFSDHPADPGGHTMKGVTQRVYDAYRLSRGLEVQSVRRISDAEVEDIYVKQYWDRVQASRLPSGIDYAVFDFAVNSGVARAAKELQRLLTVKQDGVIGEITLASARALSAIEVVELIADYCHARLQFMRRLKTWPTFGRGWTRRVMGAQGGAQAGDLGVIDYAVAMADAEPQRAPAAIGTRPGEVNGRAEGSISLFQRFLALFSRAFPVRT